MKFKQFDIELAAGESGTLWVSIESLATLIRDPGLAKEKDPLSIIKKMLNEAQLSFIMHAKDCGKSEMH